jgi:long-chain acyl-CoA synthetase
MTETLIGFFLDTVAKHGKSAQFLRHQGSGWEAIAARRALDEVESVALGLRELGIQRGDHVAILAETRYEWAVSDLAILGLGAVTVPIYTTLTAAQCRYILGNAEAKLVIVSSSAQLEKIRSVRSELPALRAIVCMDSRADGDAQIVGFATVQERGAAVRNANPDAFTASARQVQPQDLATIIYTSGTTGDPKGAMLTHANIASNVDSCLAIIDLGPHDTCLSFLPLSHIFERMGGFYAMIRAGATIAYARGIDTVAADAVEVRPTVLIGVPRFYEKVHARVLENAAKLPPLRRRLFHWGLARGLERARARFAGRSGDSFLAQLADRLVASKIRERIGGRVRFGVSGGAPLPKEVMEFFFAIGVPLLEGYGLTETSPVITLNRPGQEKPGSVGPPIPGVEVRIAAEGEVVTRGPHVMRGYFRNEEATRQAIRDGWFHTGDVGRLDADGTLAITDRLKDLIVTAGGKKVAPQPLERRLKQSPWISDAALLGDRRPYIVCLIVPDFAHLEREAKARGWAADSRKRLLESPAVLAVYQEELDRLNHDLAQYEQVKKFALLEDEWSPETGELTPTLKVRRRVLDQKYGDAIERLYGGARAVA